MTIARSLRIVLPLCLVLHGARAEEQYDFDASAFEKKPFSLNGNVELRPSLALLNCESQLYAIKYGMDGGRRLLDAYFSRLEMAADYTKGPLFFHASGLWFINYVRHDALLDYDISPYEAYGRAGFERTSTNVWLGKRTFKWGKGYAYNPTAFITRPKDLNDIETSLEGYWSVSGEYIRSFSSPVSTLALSAAIIPEYDRINTGYLGKKGIAGAVQLYLFAFDMDIDFCFYSDHDAGMKAGVDFSRNIGTNLEIHGEAAYLSRHETVVITKEKTLETVSGETCNALLGIRYLTKWNTTVIVEYIRNGQGFTGKQMDAYHASLQAGAALSPELRDFLNLNAERYIGQFAMQNYQYTRISHPEPFGILYLTPSMYALVNIDDASLMWAFEIVYTRFKNTSLTVRTMHLQGEPQSEYGSKIKKTQVECRARYFF